MKDKLPSSWKEATLNDVCEIITDGTHHTPKYENSGVIFLSSKNVTKGQIDWSDVKYVSDNLHRQLQKRVSPKINDILLAKNGTTGVAAIVDKDLVFDIYVSLALLRPKNEVLPKFLLNFINSPKAKEQFNSRLKGVGVPNLHLREIKEVNLNLPSLDEQKQIISFLDKTFEKLDQAIALVEENIQKLKQLNESVLDEVFRNDNFTKVKIKTVVQKTGQFNPQNNPETEYTYIDISAIDKEIQKITNPNSFVGENAPSRAKKHIQIGDIVFATTRPNLKNIALVENEYLNPVASTGFCVLRVNEKIETNFLFHFLTSQIIQEQIAPLIRGAQYPAISDNDLLGCEIPLPSIAEQQSIVAYLDHITEKNQKLTQYYQNKLDALKRLKNSVLDSAFKGELRREKTVELKPATFKELYPDPYIRKNRIALKKRNARKSVLTTARIIDLHQKNNQKLGHTKVEKINHAIEYIVGYELYRDPVKNVGGPVDFYHTKEFVEPFASEKNVFEVLETEEGYIYETRNNFDLFLNLSNEEFGSFNESITNIIQEFLFLSLRETELYMTVYSGWNNLLKRTETVNLDSIYKESIVKWINKSNKFNQTDVERAINWLNNKDFIPKGNGKEVK